MNYIFLCMSIFISVAYEPLVASQRSKPMDSKTSARLKKARELKAPELEEVQTPEQKDFYSEFMLNWARYLEEYHPAYSQYLPTKKTQVADNYAQYIDYQLQIELLDEEQFAIVNKIKNIEEAIIELERQNVKIRTLEDERLLRKLSISDSEL